MSISRAERDAARWAAVLATARDAIISIDETGCITLFNPMAEQMFGYTADEILGRNVGMLMPPPYRDQHDSYIRNYRTTGVARAIGRIRTVEAQRKSGEIFPIELSVSESRIGDETIYTAVIRDISDKVRLENELRVRVRQQATVAMLGIRALARPDLSAFLHETIDAIADTLGVEYVKILELLPDGRTLRVVAGTGWNPGVVGDTLLPVTAGSHMDFVLRAHEPTVIDDLAAERRFDPLALLRDHNVVSGIGAIIGGPDRPYGILGTYTASRRQFSADDASFLQAVANIIAESIARDRAEAALRESQQAAQRRERLADIGAITARVVHDLGNPLAALSMQAQLILRRARRGDFHPREPVIQPAEQILATLQRLQFLVQEFTEFAREQRLVLTEARVADLLREVGDLWRPLAAARSIDLTVLSPPPDMVLRADTEKLKRVFDNLVKNAIEAIDKPPGKVILSAAALGDGSIRIALEDTGSGIPPGLDAFRLFETTKAEGTGIGLAIARQIVEAHGGTIAHHPRKPYGTVFEVTLPQHSQPVIFERSSL